MKCVELKNTQGSRFWIAVQQVVSLEEDGLIKRAYLTNGQTIAVRKEDWDRLKMAVLDTIFSHTADKPAVNVSNMSITALDSKSVMSSAADIAEALHRAVDESTLQQVAAQHAKPGPSTDKALADAVRVALRDGHLSRDIVGGA